MTENTKLFALNAEYGSGESGGSIFFVAGAGDYTGGGGDVFLQAGYAGNIAGASGGSVIATARNGADNGSGGGFSITCGNAGGGSGLGQGGEISLNTGNSPSGPAGKVIVTLGTGGGGVRGLYVIDGLPSSNPSVLGALWNDGGVVKISAG